MFGSAFKKKKNYLLDDDDDVAESEVDEETTFSSFQKVTPKQWIFLILIRIDRFWI